MGADRAEWKGLDPLPISGIITMTLKLNLQPDESPVDGPGTDKGYGKDPVGHDKETCKKKAQEGGAVVYDEHAQACWWVFGPGVLIQKTLHSVQEFAEIYNLAMHVQSSAPAMPTQEDLPGPVNTPGIGGKVQFTA